MIKLSTDDPRAAGRITFCLMGRVVKATLEKGIVELTYEDARTVQFATWGLTFDFPGTRQDALSMEFEEPSSADR